MIERSFDFERANWIINHPDVLPFVAFDDTPLPLSIEPLVTDHRNYLLMSPHGGFFLHNKNAFQDAFELHTFYLPIGRGREVHDAARDMFEFMFVTTPATRIYTTVPDDAPHAKPPLSFGWRPCFTRNDLFTRKGQRIGAQYWRLEFWDWAYKQKHFESPKEIISEVWKTRPAKARSLAQEWAEWSGEVIECQ